MAASDPGSRPDATGRRLAFLPAALLGNGSLLVTLSARGEVERMLWPHVDGPNNVRELRLGVGSGGDVDWLDEAPAEWTQAWEGNASVLRTTVARSQGSVLVVDAVDPDEPVLVRRVEAPAGVLAVSATPLLEGHDRGSGAWLDRASGAIVFHRRVTSLAIATTPTAAIADIRSGRGRRDDVAHVSPLRGRLETSHGGVVHVVVALGATPFDALERARRHLARADGAATRRARRDARLLAPLVRIRESLQQSVTSHGRDAAAGLEQLVRRSVLVLEQLTDAATGGIVAAPEMDERFVESGGYGFVWPRDLAYVVLGLLAAGRDDAAAAALRWLARTQTPEGLWLHRYWTTGQPAPSWGLHQIDETGAVLLAAEASFWQLGDDALDGALWPAVHRGAELLVSFLDRATGLPMATVDLWEQQEGQHAYTAAAVAGGLRSAALAAERHEPARASAYREAARRVTTAIDQHLWDATRRRHRRAVNVARRDRRGEAPGSAYDRSLPYPNRRVRSVDPVDDRLDSSLLGLAWPFLPFGAGSSRVRESVDAVADGLATASGGLHRHEGDTYAGGHEWPLATLWLALARRALGDDAAHARALGQAVGRRTSLDLLPEQVTPDGRPAWVLPLGWSHAMLLLAAQPELRLVERLQEEVAGDGRGG